MSHMWVCYVYVYFLKRKPSKANIKLLTSGPLRNWRWLSGASRMGFLDQGMVSLCTCVPAMSHPVAQNVWKKIFHLPGLPPTPVSRSLGRHYVEDVLTGVLLLLCPYQGPLWRSFEHIVVTAGVSQHLQHPVLHPHYPALIKTKNILKEF